MRSMFRPSWLLTVWLTAAWMTPDVYSSEPQYVIVSVAGSNLVGDGGSPAAAQLAGAEGVAVDSAGNVYIADSIDHRVRKVNISVGTISTVAGNGHMGQSGDSGPADHALLNRPYGVAVDGAGSLYIADYGNGAVRKVSTDGVIQTVAGGGKAAFGGFGGDALGARFVGPRNVAVDSAGVLYVADFADHRVHRVMPGGQIEIVAGTGVAGYTGEGTAASARLNAPAGLAVDREGNLYIADSGNNRIRRVSRGMISTVAGPEALVGRLLQPTGVAMDPSGALYVADSGNSRILRRSPTGVISVVAGADSSLGPTRDVATDGWGNLYVADGRRVRKITGAGSVLVFAGDGTFGYSAEGAPAHVTYLNGPIGLAIEGNGALLVVEEGARRVRRIDAQGFVRTVAGTGAGGFGGDNGLAVRAQLADPVAVASDLQGGFWIADYLGNRVRRVLPSGIIGTAAGNGVAGFDGDYAQGRDAQLNRPRGVAADAHGNLYIADSLNHRVRRLGLNGSLTTVAGNGVRGYGGDGGAAMLAQLNSPAGVCLDAGGNLLIADYGNHVVRRVTPEGIISTVAGTGARAFSGDNGPAARAELNSPLGVAAGADGSLYIADSSNHRIRKVSADGIIRTIGGNGTPGFSGDGGPATAAQLQFPSGIAVDSDGRVYVADLDNHRVRALIPTQEPLKVIPLVPSTVVHAATSQTGPVAPGQIVSIFGSDIGPATAQGARLSASGVLESSLGETEVRFDGQPAPLFFARPDQINAQVPYSVAGGTATEMEIFQGGLPRSRLRLQVAASAPGIFTVERGVGQAVAVNEDGTMNSTDNPAPRGSIMTIYATGEGQTDPPGVSGKPSQAPYPRPALPADVRIGGLPVEILYLGSAPGLAGLMQINVRVPGGFAPSGVLPVILTVGGAASQPGVTIAVR